MMFMIVVRQEPSGHHDDGDDRDDFNDDYDDITVINDGLFHPHQHRKHKIAITGVVPGEQDYLGHHARHPCCSSGWSCEKDKDKYKSKRQIQRQLQIPNQKRRKDHLGHHACHSCCSPGSHTYLQNQGTRILLDLS